jgi:hypothetical protein
MSCTTTCTNVHRLHPVTHTHAQTRACERRTDEGDFFLSYLSITYSACARVRVSVCVPTPPGVWCTFRFPEVEQRYRELERLLPKGAARVTSAKRVPAAVF